MKWFDNNKKEIAENDHFKWVNPNRRRILRILNLKESDEGIYTCIGRNNLGTDKGEIFLNVTCKCYLATTSQCHLYIYVLLTTPPCLVSNRS